ncbi:hypothetical protein [Deinococcus sp. Marseille-Q6407]|uniref:hypothetical protein n=1 Tax=Deinococcus sp. Marseille-Q6407 TaxID=2969223 RepID=UPI0021BE5796|nr:hypothetical protein [Deinococcus sp. Marseille-Q6407]
MGTPSTVTVLDSAAANLLLHLSEQSYVRHGKGQAWHQVHGEGQRPTLIGTSPARTYLYDTTPVSDEQQKSLDAYHQQQEFVQTQFPTLLTQLTPQQRESWIWAEVKASHAWQQDGTALHVCRDSETSFAAVLQTESLRVRPDSLDNHCYLMCRIPQGWQDAVTGQTWRLEETTAGGEEQWQLL